MAPSLNVAPLFPRLAMRSTYNRYRLILILVAAWGTWVPLPLAGVWSTLDGSVALSGGPFVTLPFASRPSLGPHALSQEEKGGAVVSSDPRLAARAEAILPEVERMSGLAARGPIRVESRSRDELRHYLLAKLDEEMPPSEMRALSDTYSLMGLVPADFDLRAALVAVYEEQVSGFYDPDSLTLFLLDDQAEVLVDGILAHELVHALQDQWLGIDSLADPRAVGNDRAMAVRAVLEGHATFVMVEQMLSGVGRTLDPSVASSMLEEMRNQATANVDGSPALTATPRIIRDPLVMIYVEGFAYVTRVWADGQRDRAIDEFFPPSTEWVLGGALDDEPVELEIAVTGGSIIDEDVLGRLELGIFTEEVVGDGWDVLGDGWGGDRYVLVEGADGARGLVWWLVWDHNEGRDAFAEAVSENLDALGARASLESIQLDGHPAVVLRVGELHGVEDRARVVGGAGQGDP